jgi:hypothetical protein
VPILELVEKEPTTLKESLLSEAAALGHRIAAQAEQAERLRGLAERLERQTEEDRHALRDLEGILGEAAQLQIDDLDKRLGGQRLERVAIRLLNERPEAAAGIHYREWFDLVRDAGYQVSGQNPLGTFLAQINRSSAIERVGVRTGRYRLRLVA